MGKLQSYDLVNIVNAGQLPNIQYAVVRSWGGGGWPSELQNQVVSFEGFVVT